MALMKKYVLVWNFCFVDQYEYGAKIEMFSPFKSDKSLADIKEEFKSACELAISNHSRAVAFYGHTFDRSNLISDDKEIFPFEILTLKDWFDTYSPVKGLIARFILG